jgi:hypothetical protein
MVVVAQQSGPRREMEAARRMVAAAQRRGAGGRARSGKTSAEYGDLIFFLFFGPGGWTPEHEHYRCKVDL